MHVWELWQMHFPALPKEYFFTVIRDISVTCLRVTEMDHYLHANQLSYVENHLTVQYTIATVIDVLSRKMWLFDEIYHTHR